MFESVMVMASFHVLFLDINPEYQTSCHIYLNLWDFANVLVVAGICLISSAALLCAVSEYSLWLLSYVCFLFSHLTILGK